MADSQTISSQEPHSFWSATSSHRFWPERNHGVTKPWTSNRMCASINFNALLTGQRGSGVEKMSTTNTVHVRGSYIVNKNN